MTTFNYLQSGALMLAASTAFTPVMADDANLNPEAGAGSSAATSFSLSRTRLPQFGSAVTSDALPIDAATGTGFARPASMSLDQVFGNFERRLQTSEQHAGNGSSMALAIDSRPYSAYSMLASEAESDGAPQLTAFSLKSRRANGQDYSVGVGGLAGNYFGAGGLDLAAPGTVSAVAALRNPYFSLAPSASHAGISREVGGIRIKFGVLKTGLNHAMATQAFDPETLSPALITVQPRINSRVLEFSKSFDSTAVSFSLMRSKERNPASGAPRSVTAFGSGAASSSAQLTGVWLLAPKIALAAQASYGRSPPSMGGTVIRSNAFALGVVASDRYHRGDRLSISVSQPIRAYGGERDPNAAGGAVDVDNRHLATLVPTGRELLAEMNYVAPIGATTYAGWTMSLRRNPNNIAGAPLEKLLGVRYMQQF